MGGDDAQNSASFTKTVFQVVLLFPVILGALGKEVMMEPEVMSELGGAARLPCQLVSNYQPSFFVVTWLRTSELRSRSIAVFHSQQGIIYPNSPMKGRVSFTKASQGDYSIGITDVKRTDEGSYTCYYLGYTIGSLENSTLLLTLVKPINTAALVSVTAGTMPVVVASCTSANGKPAAQISWATRLNGNTTIKTEPGTKSTETVTYEYWLIPTAADDGKHISCVIKHPSLDKAEVIKMRLSIEHAPEVTIVGYDDNWYVGRSYSRLTCLAKANPPPTSVTWKVLSGPMPETVRIKGNVLAVLPLDEAMNVTFVCEVANRLGVGRQQLTPVVRRRSPQTMNQITSGITGGFVGTILLLVFAGTVVWTVQMCCLKSLRVGSLPIDEPSPLEKTDHSGGRQHSSQASGSESQLLSQADQRGATVVVVCEDTVLQGKKSDVSEEIK
ncbi:nectin-2-like [Scleropages formosus]|uniref:nectin-2-like n=1 Tax=Scleropages formosus TaxID=113540 RepID=UPI0008781DA0|nr:nectin-2-like [Scleropages formosus]